MEVTASDSIDEALKNVAETFVATLELYEHLERPLPKSIQSLLEISLTPLS